MQLLEPAAYPAAQAALAAMRLHQAVGALLAGRVPGEVWADDAARPNLAIACVNRRCFVGGGERAEDAALVRALLEGRLLPAALASGQGAIVVHATAEAWQADLDAALSDLLPDRGSRQYYERAVSPHEAPGQLPPGFSLRAADAALLAEPSLHGLDELREEMCSERPSVAAFLAESFGVVALAGSALAGSALAGWCLSEYNLAGRCEVGIATLPPYQRQGLATALTQAFLAHAAAQGITTAGWHCWTNNTPSVATARRAGFTHVADEVVRLRRFL